MGNGSNVYKSRCLLLYLKVVNIGNPYCPKDKKLMIKKHSGSGAIYKCPKCGVTYKAGQDRILFREPEKEISEADKKLMGEKGVKKAIPTFMDKVARFREMRRRKSHRHEEPVISTSPMQEIPEEEAKPALLTTPFNVGVINYQCKACGTKFEGLAGETKCIACDSNDIIIVENKTSSTGAGVDANLVKEK